MQLKEFADTLRNIENDRMIMSYGNNATVVGSVLSVVDLVQSISRTMRQDRMNDVFTMNISNQLMQFESAIIMFGMQRLSQNGINLPPQLAPYGSAPMYNQPAYNPNMMYSGAPNFGGGAPQQFQPQYQQGPASPQYQAQPQYQQAPPQYQAPPQQAEAPAAAAAPPPPPPQAAAPAPAPQAAAPAPAPKPVANADDGGAKPAGGNKGASMGLPGMGGGSDEKAAGRDYLLNLLGDKE